MRDERFIAIHRGGSLTKEDHIKLMRWARECSEHVLSFLNEKMDRRLVDALHAAEEWENGNATVGDAMKASAAAHGAAREYSDPTSRAVARSIGQAVATAHMSDHSIGAGLYALKAVYLAGGSVDEERKWQNKKLKHLPSELAELVQTTITIKIKGLRI